MRARYTFLSTLIAGLLCAFSVNAASTQRIAVVVANDGSWLGLRGKLTVRQLARTFRKQLLVGRDGQRLHPVNLPPEHPLRIAISRKLFGRDPVAMARYWSEQYFNGVSPPHVVDSQEAMMRFIATTPGAIGYIVECRVDDRVKVLLKLKLVVAGNRDFCREGKSPVRKRQQ
jgi:hypothetical protein